MVEWSAINTAESNSRSDAASEHQDKSNNNDILLCRNSPYGNYSIQPALEFHFQCPFLNYLETAFQRDASYFRTSKLCMEFPALRKQRVICSSPKKESWDCRWLECCRTALSAMLYSQSYCLQLFFIWCLQILVCISVCCCFFISFLSLSLKAGSGTPL